MAFTLLQIIYWIALATWFGVVLFIHIAVPIIFKSVSEHNPILPMVLSVNLEGQHGSLLAGTIVANLISQLKRIELICAGGLAIGLIGQWALSDIGGQNWLFPLLRTAMFIAALGLVLFDWTVIWPKLTLFRDQYIAHADEPDVANPANDEFNRYQRESEFLLKIRLALLLALVPFSANVRPRQVETSVSAGRAQLLQRESKSEAGEWKRAYGNPIEIEETTGPIRPGGDNSADLEEDLSERKMFTRLFNAAAIAGRDDSVGAVYG
jgi:hypothetical protein